MALDLREMSFQNVIDTILKPAGVKVGGFPEEIFTDLTEEEKENWICNICFLLVKDTRQCDNKHLFCHTCIFAWTLTYGENSEKCPMCRCELKGYSDNKDVDKKLNDKRVKCPEEGCSFKAPLKVFLMHSHGRTLHSNAHVDLESLRPPRPSGTRLLVFPPGMIDLAGTLGATTGFSRAERAAGIRSQLQQGRQMIHQMMLLLHLEMQLRQQALVSYQEARDPVARLHRLDEVLALNEQLNEVGSILAALLNSPLNTTGAGPLAAQNDVGRVDSPALINTTFPSRLGMLGGPLNHREEDDSDADSDSSEHSTVLPNMRLNYFRQSNTRETGAAQSDVNRTTSSVNNDILERSRRRSEIRQDLLNRETSQSGTSRSDAQASSSLNRNQDSSSSGIRQSAQTQNSSLGLARQSENTQSISAPTESVRAIVDPARTTRTLLARRHEAARARDTPAATSNSEETVQRFNITLGTPRGNNAETNTDTRTDRLRNPSLPPLTTPRTPASTPNPTQSLPLLTNGTTPNPVARSNPPPPRGPGVPAERPISQESESSGESESPTRGPSIPPGSTALRRAMDELGSNTQRHSLTVTSTPPQPQTRPPPDPAASTNEGVFSVSSQRPLGARAPPLVPRTPVRPPQTPGIQSERTSRQDDDSSSAVTTTQLYESVDTPVHRDGPTRSMEANPTRLTTRPTANRTLTQRPRAGNSKSESVSQQRSRPLSRLSNTGSRNAPLARPAAASRRPVGGSTSTRALTLPGVNTDRSTGSRSLNNNVPSRTSRQLTQRRPAGTSNNPGSHNTTTNAATSQPTGATPNNLRPRRRSEINNELLYKREKEHRS